MAQDKTAEAGRPLTWDGHGVQRMRLCIEDKDRVTVTPAVTVGEVWSVLSSAHCWDPGTFPDAL